MAEERYVPKSTCKFLVVEFMGSDDVGIVASKWLTSETSSMWPGHMKTTSRLERALTSGMTPDENWEEYPIRVLKETNDFSKALRLCKQAEEDSDLQTETEMEEAPRKRQRKYESDEDENPLNIRVGLNTPAPRPTLNKSASCTGPSTATSTQSLGQSRNQLTQPSKVPAFPVRTSRTPPSQSPGQQHQGPDSRLLEYLIEIKQYVKQNHRPIQEVLRPISGTSNSIQPLPAEIEEVLPMKSIDERRILENYKDNGGADALVNHKTIACVFFD